MFIDLVEYSYWQPRIITRIEPNADRQCMYFDDSFPIMVLASKGIWLISCT